MKVIIAGSRSIRDDATVAKAIEESGFQVDEVVCGMAPGVDLVGLRWAQQRNLPVARFPAKWSELGKSAGYVRNREMADYADALIAVWDGVSSGTSHMISLAEARKLKVFVKIVV